VLVEALASHLATYKPGVNGLVLTDDEGCALRRSRFSAKVWRPAVAASEVPVGTVFHDLRHYYAGLLIHAGESVKTVQARLGHASAIETLDTYGHLWPDSEDRTRSVVQAASEEAASGPVEDPLRTTPSA
jgi:integrase